MDFQALTGSVAFAVTQTAVALFMAGLYVAARRDTCTRYWAVASALVAVGVIAPFPFTATPFRLMSMALGTTAIVAGLVWMWWGMRVFFGRRPKPVGWWLIGLHAAIFMGVFVFSSETQLRVITFALMDRELLKLDGGQAVVASAAAARVVRHPAERWVMSHFASPKPPGSTKSRCMSMITSAVFASSKR